MTACFMGYTAIASLLVEVGAELNLQDEVMHYSILIINTSTLLVSILQLPKHFIINSVH